MDCPTKYVRPLVHLKPNTTHAAQIGRTSLDWSNTLCIGRHAQAASGKYFREIHFPQIADMISPSPRYIGGYHMAHF